MMKHTRIFFMFMLFLISFGNGYCETLFRFDMGTTDSPLKEGYTRISPESLYSAKTGYGWTVKPAEAFDRTKSRAKGAWYQKFWGEQVVGKDEYYGEPVDDLWRDGIADKKDMRFRVNIPNGIYNVFVTLGDEEWARLDMNVAAEDTVVLSDVRTWIYWGAYPAHRRMMFRVAVKDNSLDIRFFNGGKDLKITLDTVETVHEVLNSVLGIEIEPYYQPRIQMAGDNLVLSPDIDCAEIRKGFGLFRKGLYDDALAEWEKIKSSRAEEAKGLLYGYVAGVVTRNDEIDLLNKALEYFDIAQLRYPNDKTLTQERERTADFLDGILRYRRIKTRKYPEPNAWCYPNRYAESGKDMLLQSTPDEPFYLKGRFDIAKVMYWNLRESNGIDQKGLDRKDFVVQTMSDILKIYPDFDMAHIYLEQKVLWGQEFMADSGNAPKWASLARETLSRQHAVIRWWADHQRPDGTMGGDQSYGDDVEMLRSWPGVIYATGDHKIVESMSKMADGVYKNVAPNGFNEGIWDVQHSAEPTADPAFLTAFDYGNPVPVERGFQFMKLYRDLFTGINPKGHRHFKSILMGAEGITETIPFACDTHYHVRAAKPGLWAMWYSGSPTAMKLFTEWADAWYDDAMRTDRGKPKGVMPSAIAYETERIGGYGPEDDWKKTASGYDYYDWNPDLNQLYDFMYTMWRTTGDGKYLEPMFMAPMLSTMAAWRSYSGDTSYDGVIKDSGGEYGKYLVSGDMKIIETELEKTLEELRYNFPLMTSEVTMTDRIKLGNVSLVQGMYTGGVPASGLPYSLGSVSWTGTGRDFAALVRANSPKGMRVSVYSFYDSIKEFGMRFWDLERGEYIVRIGTDADDDGTIDSVGGSKTYNFTMNKRGDTFKFSAESKKLFVIEIKQIKKYPEPKEPMPDIAFTTSDVDWARDIPKAGRGAAVSVLVHNIGGKQTGPFTVLMSVLKKDGTEEVIDSVRFPGIDAPNDFSAKTEAIALAGYVPPDAVKIVIEADPKNETDEIYEGNNRVEIGLIK